ncbi:MAG: RtcB family protein [Phycisphaera sp.]|nr:RtcB family protein [Phycisphaera sp.]
MNARQLLKLGVPANCVKQAVMGIASATQDKSFKGTNVKKTIAAIVESPGDHVADQHFGAFAQALIDAATKAAEPLPEPIDYAVWGAAHIEAESHAQMRQACALPGATGAALMPDAHVGYGLPIGGVLALEGKVVPYAVGVDIACRMKLSVLSPDLPTDALSKQFNRFKEALEGGTRFGVGADYQRPKHHDVMDRDWSITRITRERKDRAWHQLGTSGSGNHFVEFGVLTLSERDEQLGLDAGQYVALLSHSGSRGAGAAVCDTYSNIARQHLPKRYEEFGRLAWLDLDSEAGAEYWAAMNLMGDYASANHAVIHREVVGRLGGVVVASVENHHNFAWKETHGGKEVIVHRKGATPAGAGVLGVIPGSMGSPAFVVRGKGNAKSLDSASHGAGRVMSRTKAKATFNFRAVAGDLKKKGVTVLSAGSDEAPGVYKDIHAVMAEQQDLVTPIARFDPKIVKMCGDGSRAED